jgi:O-antigen/teichoic acid export membrane protein
MTYKPPPGTMQTRATRAAALFAVMSIVSRLVLVGSNWALGSLLSENAFGINGMVGIASTLIWAFVSFGLDDVLVQRGRPSGLWESTTFSTALLISSAAAIGLMALAPVFAWAFDEPSVIGPLALVALSLPIASLSTVPGAKIHARMEFGFIVQWSFVELVLGQVMTIVLAFLGFGAYSFVLPVVAVMIARAIAYNLHSPMAWKPIQRRSRRGKLLRKGAMAVGGKVASGIATQADYIVLAVMASTSALGFYYFAFRIAALPVRTIATSLASVLFPALSSYRGDPDRQSAAAIRAASLICWIVAPLCYFQMAVARPLLASVFGDKWLPSVPVIEFLSVGLCIEAVMAVARAYLGASGKFHVGFAYAVANGIGYFMACIIGAYFGSITGLALAVSLYYVLTQPIAFILLVDRTNQKFKHAIDIFALPALVSAVSFGGAWYISRLSFMPQGSVWQMAQVAVIGGILFLVLAALTAKNTFAEILGLGRSFLRRTPPSVAEDM